MSFYAVNEPRTERPSAVEPVEEFWVGSDHVRMTMRFDVSHEYVQRFPHRFRACAVSDPQVATELNRMRERAAGRRLDSGTATRAGRPLRLP